MESRGNIDIEDLLEEIPLPGGHKMIPMIRWEVLFYTCLAAFRRTVRVFDWNAGIISFM